MAYITTVDKKEEKEGMYIENSGTSLAVRWLRHRSSTAGGTGSIPGQGTKIPHAAQHGQKIEKRKKKRKFKQYRNK